MRCAACHVHVPPRCLTAPPPALLALRRSDGELLVALITRHLVRLLKTAPNLQVLDGATLAIQELLRSYSQADGLEELAAQQAQQAGQGGGKQAQGRASREPSPADSGAAKGNLLFAALAVEVQVGAWPAASHACVPCRPWFRPAFPSSREAGTPV